MTWDELDWPALDRLRDGFLSGQAANGPYWQSAADLAAYDFTYGERIGWKWDHVLRELRLRGWEPRSRDVFDWGCGSGIAHRRVLSFFGAERFDTVTVWDHSPAAADFSVEAAGREFPGLRIASATPGLLAAGDPLGLIVISHVLNELSAGQAAELRRVIERAGEVLWVEPGTSAVSRQLGRWRDELAAQYDVVAPCTHPLGCPMFAPGAERDWCHFFAPPPSEIFADSNWVKFGQRAGIDLRSLPYCFLALSRRRAELPAKPPTAGTVAVAPEPHASRIIGRPEHFKPYARWLNCDATGLNWLELPKRAAPALYKELERTKAPLVYQWQREGTKVTGGARLGAPGASPQA